MRKLAAAVLVFATGALAAPGASLAPAARVPAAELDFTRTMRVDYVHRGGPAGESWQLDGIAEDGPWPGSRTTLIDDTNLGEYLFEVIEPASKSVLYSRGFASIYGEWKTTPEFKEANRTFQESVRFPWPRVPVRLIVRGRDRDNAFRDLWSTEIDPDRVSGRRRTASGVRVVPIFESGPVESKVDVLLISEGYSRAQFGELRAHATRLVNALFAMEPFKTRRSDFNVRLLEVSDGPLPVEFNVFGIERYALTYANRVMHDRASAAPYDVVEILMNDEQYGGGGIFNQQSTVAAANRSAEYVFVHEFAHNLAGLADEYVGSVTYETGVADRPEPWEPNITALPDPARLKWRDLVTPGTPIPTPPSYAGAVGAFEGGGYEARGLFRGELECIMGAHKTTAFCRVCQRAINRIIDLHTN